MNATHLMEAESKGNTSESAAPSTVDPRRCHARAKSTGERCGKWAMAGRKTCRLHGGASLRGAAAPAYRGKGYSKYAPVNIAKLMEDGATDAEMLGLMDEIRAFTSRFKELLQRLKRGDHALLSPRASREARRLKTAIRRRNKRVIERSTVRLISLVEATATEQEVWAELDRLAGRIQRLVESERRRAVELQQTMRISELLVLTDNLLNSMHNVVHAHCSSEQATVILDRVRNDFAKHLFETTNAASIK